MKINNGIGPRLTAKKYATWEKNEMREIVSMSAAMYRLGLKNMAELAQLIDKAGFPAPQGYIGWDAKVFELWRAQYLESKATTKTPTIIW